MVTTGVTNLGLDSVGILLAIRRGSPIVGSNWRGSSRVVGVGVIGRGERCVGLVTDERGNGGVSLGKRWRRRKRRQTFDAATFRVTAADDVEKEGVVGEEGEEEEEAASSSQRFHQLSSRETPKISRIEQQQQRTRVGKQQRTKVGKQRTPNIFSNLVEEWVTREKGDVRDVVLMSLSFAVLIYISQHLVHAYCTLRHMYFKHY